MKKMIWLLSYGLLGGLFAFETVSAQQMEQVKLKIGDPVSSENHHEFRINVTAKEGAVAGMKGKLVKIWESGDEDGGVYCGEAEITQLDSEGAIVKVDIDSEVFLQGVEESDLLVELSLKIDRKDGLLKDLGKEAIGLLKVEGQTLFDPQLWLKGGEEEDADGELLIYSSLQDIAFTAQEMRGQMEEPEVQKGRFTSWGLFDAMEKSNELDLELFFSYVTTRPEKYAGNTWKISEIYATWLDAGSPVPVEATADRLVQTHDIEEQVQIIDFFDHQGVERLITALCDKGEAMGASGNFKDAYEIFDRAAFAAEQFENYDQMAWIWFSRGDMEDKAERPAKAEKAFRQAYEYFSWDNEPLGMGIVCNNIGSALMDQGKYKKAKEDLSKGIAELEEWKKDKEAAALSPVLGLLYRNLGKCWMKEKKYKNALAQYEKGQVYLESYDGEKAQIRLRGLYEQMESCLLQMGKKKRAAEIKAKRMSM